MVFNESYFITDREKAINEARLEAIQEAVTVAVIAAIIAVIAAIIGLLVAAVKIFGKGASAVSSKIDTNNAKKLDKLDNSKKEEIADKVEEKVNGGGQDKDHVEQKGPLQGLCIFDYRTIIKTDECKQFSKDIEKIKNNIRNKVLHRERNIANGKAKFEICPEITNSINKEQNEISDEDIKQAFISHYNKNATKFDDCIKYAMYIKAKDCVDKVIPDSKDLANTLLDIMKDCETNVKEIQKKVSDINGDGELKKSLENFVDDMKKISDTSKYIKKFLNSWIWIEQQRLKDINIYITVCNKYIKETPDGKRELDMKDYDHVVKDDDDFKAYMNDKDVVSVF